MNLQKKENKSNKEFDYQQFVNQLKREGYFNADMTLDHWAFRPVDFRWLKTLEKIANKGNTFLDLGCGAGNILYYADSLGYKCTGVEFNPEFEKFLQPFDYQIKDIQKLDPEFYSKFDVVYAYLPLKEDRQDYYQKVISNIKTGAYWFCPFQYFDQINLIEVHPFIYRKK